MKKLFIIYLLIILIFSLSCMRVPSKNNEEKSSTTDFTKIEDKREISTLDGSLISDSEALEIYNKSFILASQYLYLRFQAGWYDDTKDRLKIKNSNGLEDEYIALQKNKSEQIISFIDDKGDCVYTDSYPGDYEWMQKSIHNIFTDEFIQKYFSYEYPCLFIHLEDTVYRFSCFYEGSNTQIGDCIVTTKTADEFEVIIKLYDFNYEKNCYDYSKESFQSPAYVMYKKIDQKWLVDKYRFIGLTQDELPEEYINNK